MTRALVQIRSAPVFGLKLALLAFVAISLQSISHWRGCWLVQLIRNAILRPATRFQSGVSFGMLADRFADRPFVLAGIGLAMVSLLAVLLLRASNCCEASALGAIIGGALGNILHRLRMGALVDSLNFHSWDYHWPAFNLADAAIVIGVASLVRASLANAIRMRTSCHKRAALV